jgi:hypothetical protein
MLDSHGGAVNGRGTGSWHLGTGILLDTFAGRGLDYVAHAVRVRIAPHYA